MLWRGQPDFAVAVYSGYLVRPETGLLVEHINIRARTPPVFLVCASDDSVSDAENSVGTASGASARGWP